MNGTTHNAEVLVGVDYAFGGWSLGYVSGNYDREGFIRGTVMIPFGASSMGPVSVWVYLHDESWTQNIGYVVNSAVSPTDYASFDPMTGTGWADSGIVATTITVVPASRPNLTVTIDQLVPGGGTVDVTYDTVTKKLTWTVSYSGLTGPRDSWKKSHVRAAIASYEMATPSASSS